jgi:hypothetical protein
MPDRRAPRLVLEVAFLAALAAALTFAGLEAYETAGVMLVGWLLVAVFEWGALRSRPHYGSGLPPQWYVPRVDLPPPRPLEQLAAGYPAAEAATDAPTWIASPADLADWPVADVEPGLETPVDEETHVHDAVDAERSAAIDVEEDEEDDDELEAPEPEAAVAPEPPRRPVPRARPGARIALHRIDPLAPAPARARRFGKRTEQRTSDAEVPDGPSPFRRLPAQARGDG